MRVSTVFAVGFVAMTFVAAYSAIQTDSLSGMNQALSSSYSLLHSQYDSLGANYTYVSSSLNQSYYIYNQLLGNYSRSRIIFNPPSANASVAIWTLPQTVPPGGLKEWNLHDTFINHINIRTNSSSTFIVLDLNNFARYSVGRNYTAVITGTGTQFSYEAHLSQGCATYVLLIVNHSSSTMQITPYVTATYAPMPFLSGQCTLH